MALNTSQYSAAVDRILTLSAQGYGGAPENVWREIFPQVTVPDRVTNKVLIFGDEHFVLGDAEEDRRAPGAQIDGITFDYSTETISYNQYARSAKIPVEHLEAADQGPGIDLKVRHVQLLQQRFDLRKEVACATLARNTASYAAGNSVTLTGAAQWSDDTSTPLTAVENAKDAVRQKIGQWPNKMIVPPAVYKRLKLHPKIMAHYARGQTGADVPITAEMLQDYFDITVIVGMAVSKTKKGGAFADVWGKDVILAYVPKTVSSQEQPSFGYMYSHAGYPLVEPYRYDADTRSWKANYLDECKPYVTGMGAGYLFKNAVA